MQAQITIHWASDESINGFEQIELIGDLSEIESFSKQLDGDVFTWEIEVLDDEYHEIYKGLKEAATHLKKN